MRVGKTDLGLGKKESCPRFVDPFARSLLGAFSRLGQLCEFLCGGKLAELVDSQAPRRLGAARDARRLEKKILERLARSRRNELDRGQRWPGLARFRQIDGGAADLTRGNLGQRKPCLTPGPLDRPGTNPEPGEPTPLAGRHGGDYHTGGEPTSRST